MPEHDLSLEEPELHSSLPPTDGGYQAWLLLAGCFVINVLIWGFSFSFGVLQQYYGSHEPFTSEPQGIAAIGTTATGLMYLLMPLYFGVLQRWPWLKSASIWASVPLVAIALVGASFAQRVAHLIACQGVLFAIGGNMMFTPTVTYLDEWFVAKKGLAIGIMWAGDGVGGVLMPLVLQALLSRYGFRTTLRAMACAMVILMMPLLKFLKPRLPTPLASAVRPIDSGFLRSKTFWTMQAFNIIQGTGYFLPSNYLPTYSQAVGLDAQFGSLALVMINLASVLGCIVVGALMDRTDVTMVVAVISTAAAASVLAVWGVATGRAPLCVFGLLYGLTAGSYSSSWTGMIKKVRAQSVTADANIVFGFLAAGRGVGAIVSGPLSEALVASGASWVGTAKLAYGTRYGPLIVYSGCSALIGGFSWIARAGGLIQ